LPFLRDDIMSIEDYIEMDEPSFMYGMSLCKKHPDMILADLARRLLTRDLYGYTDIENEKSISEMKKKVEACGFDSEYYFTVDRAKQQPYQPYRGKESSLIWVMLKDGRIRELSHVSVIVQAIVKGEDKSDRKMFFPKSCIEVSHEQ
jgi:HD superfamily phosphohydrolase